MTTPNAAGDGPELVFGLVGPMGVQMKELNQALQRALGEVAYSCRSLRLIELAREGLYPDHAIADNDFAKTASAKMDLGNLVRQESGRGGALAGLGVAAIRKLRQVTGHVSKPLPRVAFVLQQLKHPDEVHLLRDVYGDRFVLVAGYSSRDDRLLYVADRIASSKGEVVTSQHRAAAELLLGRDEDEGGHDAGDASLGQHVRDTFPMADVFVDTTNPKEMELSLQRMIRAMFGYIVHTPTKDEQGMFFAKAAAIRSSALSRQVGAAICTNDGDVLSIGTNDVPKAGGGLYWEGDLPDHRTFVRKTDVSEEHRTRLLINALQVLQKHDWLSTNYQKLTPTELLEAATAGKKASLFRQMHLADVIEYVREVHAEMAAVTSAARRGISIDGSTLFVTTFPCHECTRHIVAAGIRRVVFIEPYAKSLAMHFHADSVGSSGGGSAEDKVAFTPFVGISPRRYMEWFEMTEARKTEKGTLIEWNAARAMPRITATLAYTMAEVEATVWIPDFVASLKAKAQAQIAV